MYSQSGEPVARPPKRERDIGDFHRSVEIPVAAVSHIRQSGAAQPGTGAQNSNARQAVGRCGQRFQGRWAAKVPTDKSVNILVRKDKLTVSLNDSLITQS